MTASSSKKQIALALNVPFCPVQCPYCEHVTVLAGDPWMRRAYFEALDREIESAAADFTDCTVSAVWVGEGIAGHMMDSELGELLHSLARRFSMDPSAEITVKVHPGMVSVETLNACRKGRVTRLFVEYETAHPGEHAALGRFLDPSAMEVTSTVLGVSARAALALDFELAIGVKGQSTSSIKRSIDRAIAYGAVHVSLRQVKMPGPETGTGEDMRAQLLGFATAYLTMQGFNQYLPSYFAQPGSECRYREMQAEGCDVLGFGLGAKTRFAGVRADNTTDLETYIAYSAVPERCIAHVSRP